MLAAATAPAQVYNTNIVGYGNTTFQPGYNWFGNPLDAPPNMLSALIPTAPNGTTVSLWSSTLNLFTPTVTFTGGAWSSDLTLSPGTGAALHTPSLFINTFVGTVLDFDGSAWVGGCNGQDIKRYTLSYQPGFTTATAGTWTQFWQVDYPTPLQIDSSLNRVFERELTSLWYELPWCHLVLFPSPHVQCDVVGDYLSAAYWSTQYPGGPFPVAFPNPPGTYPDPPAGTWNSVPLALPNCQSGKYTLRLTVEDTGGNVTDNLRQVWFDNKNIYGKIAQIGMIPACTTITLAQFATGGGDCKTPWPAPLLGIAYDEYIEENNATVPSDNFGGYLLEIRKDGGGWHSIPIPGPGGLGTPPVWGGPFTGTSRIGDPGVRCANAMPAPLPPPAGTAVDGILAMLDMRRLDAVCNPSEPDLTLQRGHGNQPGECCGFIIHLQVWDTSVCPSLTAGRHQVDDYFPFCICNDLRPAG